MLKRLFSTAIIAGVVAGLLVSVIHEFTTTPIILHAEEYEGVGEDHHALWRGGDANLFDKAAVYDEAQGRFYLIDDGHGEEDGDEVWGPEDGLERTLFTTLANVLTGVGFAAILAACFVFSGEKLSGRRGVIWGMAGFAVFTLAPVLGLPPEVPGSMAADLQGRQIWWIGTAVATGIGLWLMVFGRKLPLHALGLVLLVLPHLIGAPQPAEIGGNAPPEIAGHFAATAIVVSAVFWAILGWLSGTLWQRSEEAAA